MLHCPSDVRGLKDEDNTPNKPPYSPPYGTGAAGNKPECSYAIGSYGRGHDGNNPVDIQPDLPYFKDYPTVTRVATGVPAEAQRTMIVTAVDMSGAYAQVAAPAPASSAHQWIWNLQNATYKNHGLAGVNALKYDGSVRWCTLKDDTGAFTQAVANVSIPNWQAPGSGVKLWNP
jgi:hypothetical protein